MNVITFNNFHKICRTCSRDEDELISLHENNYLIEMIRLCAQIEFETNDNLPQQICLSCIDELNKTYTFTIKCKMVDAALRNYLRQHKLANVEPSNGPSENDKGEFNILIKTETCENPNEQPQNTETIICTQCKEAFTSLSDLISHQQLERHFCVLPSTQDPNKNRKRENTNPKKDRTFQCRICNKTMNNLSNFRRHEQIHSGEKRFTCTVCNKNFRHSGTLVTHQRSHSGERPCICDVCGKTYVDLSTLGRHKKIHTGEKKYHCDICNKRFTQSGDLTVHKRLHFEKPFSCEICGKRFNRRTHLANHSKVHAKHIKINDGVDEIEQINDGVDEIEQINDGVDEIEQINEDVKDVVVNEGDL